MNGKEELPPVAAWVWRKSLLYISRDIAKRLIKRDPAAIVAIYHEMVHSADNLKWTTMEIERDPKLLSEEINTAQVLYLEYRAERISFELFGKDLLSPIERDGVIISLPRTEDDIVRIIRMMARADVFCLDWKGPLSNVIDDHSPDELDKLEEIYTLINAENSNPKCYEKLAKILSDNRISRFYRDTE